MCVNIDFVRKWKNPDSADSLIFFSFKDTYLDVTVGHANLLEKFIAEKRASQICWSFFCVLSFYYANCSVTS